MVDWNSPEILRLSLLLFRQTAVFVLGSYMYVIPPAFTIQETQVAARGCLDGTLLLPSKTSNSVLYWDE